MNDPSKETEALCEWLAKELSVQRYFALLPFLIASLQAEREVGRKDVLRQSPAAKEDAK